MMCVWILLLIGLKGQTDAQSQHCCADASSVSSDKISCPIVAPPSSEQQIKLHLYLNNTLLCTLDINEGTYSFQVPSSESGAFCCQTENLYPPPYRAQCQTTQLELREEQNLPAANQNVVPTNRSVVPANQTTAQRALPKLDLVAWSVSGFLLVYSLSITCIAIYIWTKLRRMKEECQSEYVNTKPLEFKRPCRV